MTETEKITVNLNDIIYFTLSEHGKEIYRKELNQTNDLIKEVGGKGWTEEEIEFKLSSRISMQLYTFMELFGSHLHPSMPFSITENNNIYIEVKDND